MTKQPQKKKIAPKPVKAPVRSQSAIDDAMTEAFINEVTEEVKNDNMKAFFKKYGLLIFSIVFLVITATVSFETIKNWREHQFQNKTSAYISAQYGQTKEDIIKTLEQIAGGRYGLYSELARLQIADLLLVDDKVQDAVNMLSVMASNDELDPRVKTLATIKLVSLKIDTAPKKEIEELLAPVLAADDSWAPIAKEYLALATAQNGEIEAAADMYTKLLQDSRISEAQRGRIQDMLSVLSETENAENE